MRIGALSLLSPTNSKRTFNLASYHSRHSLTWSWSISVSFDGVWRKPAGGPRLGFHSYRTNDGPQLVVVAPFLVLHWHRQREMWFRDLYRGASDREEELERRISKLRRDLTMARATALVAENERPR